MTTVSIVGVTGYGGGELIRLLTRHPYVTLASVVSESNAGKPLATAFAGLHKTAAGALVCRPKSAVGPELPGDVVFLAQESGYAMEVAEALLDAGKRVIDLSADFRLTDTEAFRRFYKSEPASERLRAEAVYGLPERYRTRLAAARLVANPGCYTTTTILALAPLLAAGVIEGRGIIVDAKSGVSGAGRSRSDTLYRFSEANETLRAYGVGGVHRHVPEIEQEIGAPVTFTPHLVPMTRGILATSYAPLAAGQTLEALYAAWERAYADEPFVVVRGPGDFPSTKDVLGSNFCHLCAAVDSHTQMAVVVSVTDNLVKGASGQAVQNLNVLCGFPETAGLEGGGLWP